MTEYEEYSGQLLTCEFHQN